jgi:hypothetical protein
MFVASRLHLIGNAAAPVRSNRGVAAADHDSVPSPQTVAWERGVRPSPPINNAIDEQEYLTESPLPAMLF